MQRLRSFEEFHRIEDGLLKLMSATQLFSSSEEGEITAGSTGYVETDGRGYFDLMMRSRPVGHNRSGSTSVARSKPRRLPPQCKGHRSIQLLFGHILGQIFRGARCFHG